MLRGLRVPVAALDRFLQENGLVPTFGDPPLYHQVDPPLYHQVDPASKLIRTKLGDDNDDSKTRLFIPLRKGRKPSDLACIAYDWITVFAQRHVNLAEELLDRPPPSFAELRSEIMRFADDDGEPSGQQKVEDLSAFFIIVTDDAYFPFEEPYLRKADLRCDYCEAAFPDWFQRQQHRQDAHGSAEGTNVLPRDL